MGGRTAFVICVAFALLGAVKSASAAPAYPDARITLEQPSGKEFQAGLYGDEWSGGYETLDGYSIEKDRKSERWEYAKRAQNGRFVAGGTAATKPAPAGLDRDLHESAAHRATRQSSLPTRSPNPDNIGTQPSIVILAQYNNRSSLGTAAAQWSSSFFGSTNSVSDYFDEVSYGQLEIVPGAESSGTADDGVVGWVDIDATHPGSDDPAGVITDENQQAFRDAVAAANPFVNFASFDSSGNGKVSPDELHVTVITAGTEASVCGAGSTATWGHKWDAANVVPVVDGVAVPEYTMFGEHHCPQEGGASYMATLGIMVHEIGHDLDLPDLYDNIDAPDDPADTGEAGDGGVGSWSVMALGIFNREPGQRLGETPGHPDAFSKSYQGWINPTVATGTGTHSLGQAATNPAAVQVLNNPGGVDWTFHGSAGAGEYFLIENRQKVGYDAALPGCGVLIWHVDETRPAGNTGNAFDARRHVDLEEADGGTSGVPYSARNASDTFLGGAFDAGSSPSSDLYNGSASGVSVFNIDASCASTMSATVTGPVVDTDPPETEIVSGPNEKTVKVKRGRTAKFVYEYGSDEAPVTYECNISDAGWKPCFQATRFRLRKGTWTLEARAVDSAGNVDATPVSDTVKVRTKRN